MARYKVGVSSDTWQFYEAYAAAKDGDVLEFEEDYWHTVDGGKITIQKSLTFEGICRSDGNGGTTYTNCLIGEVIVANGVTVTFKNIWFSPPEKSSAFIVRGENTVLNLDTVVFENERDTTTHFMVLIQSKASAHFQNVEVKPSVSGEVLKCHDNASITVTNSPSLHCRLTVEQAKANITESCITYAQGNVLHISKNAHVNMTNTDIISNVSPEKDWPAIWVENAVLHTENCEVTYPLYTSAVTIRDRAVFSSREDTMASLSIKEAVVYFDNTTIRYGMFVHDTAHIRSKNTLTFNCEFSEKYDLMMGKEATFVADIVRFANIESTPYIKLSDSAFVHVQQIVSTEDPNIETLDVSQFVQAKTRQQGQTSDQLSSVVEETIEKDALSELNDLVGLHQVKQSVQMMVDQVAANRKRIEKGLKPLKQTLHAVFVGNPGTGKTTVARLLGKVLFQYGALAGDEFKFVEVSESDLISNYVGDTAKQTKAKLEAARGGVLFIDEAYTLNKKDASTNFGQESIDTIMKYMEDFRDEIMVIFAGYTKEMDEFLKTNPGLVSRAPNRFVFEDYTANEIIQLGEAQLNKEQLVLEDKDYYAKQVTKAYNQSLDKSNGRWIRNFNEQIMKAYSSRIIQTDTDDVETIVNSDIDTVLNQGRFEDVGRVEDAMTQLNELIGIHRVKQQVQEFIYQVEANQKKEEMGMKVSDFTLHSLFLGNPGTGKTTVARIIGKILYQKGIIATSKFIEASRSDLVAGYVGQTAMKTRSVLESALGGVLFIDEAYTLNGGSGNDFGKEAIEEILKFMEDHRRDIVIIFAGYTKEMSEFLQMNSGLTSRIPTTFDFEDYTAEEIVQIGLLGLKQYHLDQVFYANMVTAAYNMTHDRSNGRWIRNFNEKILRNQSARLIQSGDDHFDVIANEDILHAKESKDVR